MHGERTAVSNALSLAENVVVNIMTRIASLFFLLTVWCFSVSGQGPKFDPNSFPENKFSVDTLTTEMSNRQVVFIVVNQLKKKEFEGTKIWLHQIWKDTKKETYLGVTDYELGWWVPNPQPFENIFILVQDEGRSGTVMLINEEGRMSMLGGNRFGIDNETNTIATTALGDGTNFIGTMNLKTMNAVRKEWNNGNRSEPWDVKYEYYQPTANDWLK